ncbi:Asparagine synthase family protein [Babesia bovis T2Bo]|uniref:Asparagine synthase, putative n=1 Tax=Babesia bovis TaxID=5865 RepID=A7AQZ4_BABBO|nr:Asparagine synthase family protein [Babesia bovis T2Bo]EDO06963.1 Asparagine synthase family protein [Babesia bovis T2Bo]|eukprot:XP_001610531.1 asparagine synthase [Babesia bovis T2Bo]
MAIADSIQLRITFNADVPGLDELDQLLVNCNKDGIVEADLYQPSELYSGYTGGVQDPSYTDPPWLFNKDSVDISHKDGNTVVRFQSDWAQFELSGTDIRRQSDSAIVAIYGQVDNWPGNLPGDCDTVSLMNYIFSLKGSFSLIYISFLTNVVYIVKDEMGFKSMLISIQDKSITIANVATSLGQRWYELPPNFMVTLGNRWQTVPRPMSNLFYLRNARKLLYNEVALHDIEEAITKVTYSLANAVKQLCDKRTQRDRVTLLFSGGLDSALLAAMVAKHVPGIDFIELINVAFKPKVAPDRITALCTYEELKTLFPGVKFNLVMVDVNTEDYKQVESLVFSQVMPNNTHMDLNIGAALHFAASLRGTILDPEVLNTPEWHVVKQNLTLLKSVNIRVTVSLKGDGTVINDKVDLGPPTEVTTEKDKLGTPKKQLKNDYDYDSYDTIEGLTDTLRSRIIQSGRSSEHVNYRSISREVLVGSGADELFGGYGRHTVRHSPEDELYSHEVDKDIKRLWKRNLGRDDRVVNAQGIRALYPYLHPGLIETLVDLKINPATSIDTLQCPEWFKSLGVYRNIEYSTFRNSEFLGEASRNVTVQLNKWILREIAFRMGLRMCVHFKKRAIQFGTRSAKIFNTLRGMSNRVASDKGAAVISHEGL